MAEPEASEVLKIAQGIVTGMSDAAVLLDRSFRGIHFNPAYVRLTGYRTRKLQRVLAAGTSPLDLLAREGDLDHKAAVQCIDSGRAIHLVDVSLTNAVGDDFLMMQSFMPVHAPSGACVGIIEALRDFSAEARVHDRYRELVEREKARAEELERLVEDRTRRLRAALEEVTRLSRYDALTHTLNRRAFAEHAEQALKLAHRHRRSSALLMCDLDHFKLLNDTYGHQAGDTVLAEVAKALQSAVRSTDRVGRFGGEEFVISLTETDPKSVLEVADRCRRSVRALPITELVPGKRNPQTVSIGAARFPEHGETLDQLVASADQALYHAKKIGRDRVVMFKQDLVPKAAVPSAAQNLPRILITDADGRRAELYENLLVAEYDVVRVATIDDALVQVARFPFDILIVDEDVAGDSGVEFLSKSLAFAPGALRVLILASEDLFLALRGLGSAHVDQFVLHEDSPASLAGAIEEALLRREVTRDELFAQPDPITSVHADHLAALGQVLGKQSLALAYQPVIAAADRSVIGYEALCRVDHPLFSKPEALYGAAARLGSLWELGRLVRGWIAHDAARIPPSYMLFVNLHPGEVADPHLLNGEPELARFAARVVLEITERTSIPNPTVFRRNIRRLRDRGYRFGIDDLGSGYASLQMVAQLEPEFVKIDRALIQNVHESRNKRNLVKSIASYCRSAGIKVVAEGVETAEEERAVIELGCDYLQGFHLGAPAPLPGDE